MKHTFLQWRTHSALKKSKAIRGSVPFTAAAKIGILFTVEGREKHEAVKRLVMQLTNEGKQVQVLEFLPKKQENPEFMYDYFTVQNLNFWGKIVSAEADHFAATPFDYLFNLDTAPNLLIDNVLACSKAKCRVGKFREEATPFFELMIETNGTLDGLIENMVAYAKKFK